MAERQYRKFVRDGVHQRSPWENLQGQLLLGEEGFVERVRDLLEDKKRIKEIPRPQRYVGRPSLEKIFDEERAKAQRDTRIYAAHMSHGYTLKEIADHLGVHYTTVSKVIAQTLAGEK